MSAAVAVLFSLSEHRMSVRATNHIVELFGVNGVSREGGYGGMKDTNSCPKLV